MRKILMRKIPALAALLLFAPASVILAQVRGGDAAGRSKAEQEVLKVMDEWIDALKRNDGPALDRMVSDDFHLVASDGRTRDKKEELEPSKSGQIKFEQLSAENVKVFVSGDTAIATGIGIFKGTAQGRPFEGRELFFDVYQKRDGRWKVLASRSTPAPPAPGGAQD
jgi:ketosteroid isomerase-like protein